jgi:hypothetical protein
MIMKRSLLSLILYSLLLPIAYAAGPQTATVLQQSKLHEAPYSDAAAIASLKAKQQVTVIRRKGGWYQVQSGKQRGWLRMSRVRLGTGGRQAGDGAEGLAQTLRFLSTGRSGASGVTVATGIRGLEAADVANAKPNHQAVGRLNYYRVQPEQARVFARNAKLKSQPLGYMK